MAICFLVYNSVQYIQRLVLLLLCLYSLFVVALMWLTIHNYRLLFLCRAQTFNRCVRAMPRPCWKNRCSFLGNRLGFFLPRHPSKQSICLKNFWCWIHTNGSLPNRRSNIRTCAPSINRSANHRWITTLCPLCRTPFNWVSTSIAPNSTRWLPSKSEPKCVTCLPPSSISYE